ncbi:hypothetical protein DV737_g4462, partial [Chaetothyriales sp. CBS 132003]
MARAAGKRQPKNPSTTSKQKTAGSNKSPSTAQASAHPSGSALPEPFTPAVSSLYPFLSTLPHDHVFLTHLDRTPTDLKRRVFLVPCLLNLLITIGLCVRIYYAVPTYIQQISAIFGYDSPYKVDVAQESTGSLIGTVFDRTFLLFADYALFSLLGSWPREFLFGSAASRFAGPVEWRWTLGFRDVEVIRKSSEKERTVPWTSDEISTLKFKTGPAMAPSKLSKTGSLLLDKDYDLDFRAILDAHRLAVVNESSPSTSEERPRLNLNDIDGCVFVYYGAQWLIWRPNSDTNTPGGTTGAARREAKESATTPQTDTQAQAPDDPKVERFKQALIDLKCRNVFYRWIEIVQFETSRPGRERSGDARRGVIIDEQQRRKALAELKMLLEAKGVSLDTVLTDIGGVQELPGF